MNPIVAKIYKKYESHPGVKRWKTEKQYLATMYLLAVLIPAMITTFVFYYLAPLGILQFGFLLAGIRMLPRFADMFMQTSYPNKLLAVELINGTLLSFLAAGVLNYL